MSFFVVLRLAVQSLQRAPIRSGLTALGIIVGVAAVITMVSIGNGARAQVEELFANFDANQISLSARTPRSQWHNGISLPVVPRDALTLADLHAIETLVPGIEVASVQVQSPDITELKAYGRRSDARVIGVDRVGLDLQRIGITRGGAFSHSDVARAANVALISQFVSKNLFDTRDPIGRVVQIRNTVFFVIGVIQDRTYPGVRDAPDDTSVVVPYTTLLKRLDPDAPISIAFKAYQPTQLNQLQQRISDLMESRRGGRKAEFVTTNVAEAVSAYTEASRTMARLLGAVATISLIVGGIGIMNIMLVNVAERRREVGTRLALGTRARDILFQFLVEAMIISGFGGIIGVGVGIVASVLLAHLSGWSMQLSVGSIMLAVLCSAGVGIFFGLHPAKRAASLEPVQALKSE